MNATHTNSLRAESTTCSAMVLGCQVQQAVVWGCRSLIVLLLLACMSAYAQPTLVKQFGPIDGQGSEPLTDAYPFYVFPSSSKTAQLLFESNQFAGTARLDVACCEMQAGGAWVPTPASGFVVEPLGAYTQVTRTLPPPPKVVLCPHAPCPPPPPALPPNFFTIAAHQAKLVGLRVTTTGAPAFGRYRASVKAVVEVNPANNLWEEVGTIKVIFNVLPAIPADAAAPNCPGQLEASTSRTWIGNIIGPGPNLVSARPLAGITSQFYDDKTKMPQKTMWSIGDAMGDENGIRYDISPPTMPLAPNQVELVFANQTAWDKEFDIFDGAACAIAGPPIVLRQSGTSPPMVFSAVPRSGPGVVNILPMTTLRLRRRVCKAGPPGVCLDNGGWDNIAVLSAPPLWSLFGGHRVTVNWVVSNGEMP